jgi:HAD superfamily hydrolase (TIGR01549 family)
MASIDTVLFDWDGTLIDSALRAFQASRESLQEFGIEVTLERYEEHYSPNWYSMYRAFQLPEHKWKDADDLWEIHYGQSSPAMVAAGKDVLEALIERDYTLGIVTSGSHARLEREVKDLGFRGVFKTIVCAEDVINKKPDPEGLNLALRNLSKKPGFCCYVGDSPEDVQMAKRANVRAIGVRGKFPSSSKLAQSDPDILLESLPQLLIHLPKSVKCVADFIL